MLSLTDRVQETYWDDVVPAIQRELERQVQKHGAQSTASPEIDDATRLVILVEEVGEVARAMTYDEGDSEDLLEEILQVSAVAAAWAIAKQLEKRAR